MKVDETRLHTWVVAAEGAPDEVNVLRMRIAEDFPSLGNPDDLELFERCQQGLSIDEIEWVDMSKGLGQRPRSAAGRGQSGAGHLRGSDESLARDAADVTDHLAQATSARGGSLTGTCR